MMKTTQRILWAICLTSFTGPFMASSINVAIPTMASEFQVPADQLSWIVTMFLLSTAATLLPCGKLADMWGRRRMYLTGVAAFGLTTLAAGLAPSLSWLIILRTLQGITLSAIFASYMPILLASHDPSEQGRVIGLSSATTYLGLSAGPFVGGILTQYVSWRAVFFFSVILLAVSYVLMASIKEEWYGSRDTGFDWWGSVLSGAGIFLFLYGLSAYHDSLTAQILFWTGLVLLIAFIWHERRTSHAILPLEIFDNLTFSMSNVASLAHYSATYAVTFLVSFHLQLLLHLDASFTGAILLTQPIVMAIFSTKAGALADRHDPRYIASAGMAVTVLGLAAFSFLPTVAVSLTVGLLLVLGLGAALFIAPNSSAIMSSAAASRHGVASSVLALMRLLGQALSMAIVTLVLSAMTASSADYTEALEQGIHLSFIILAAACLGGIFASLARGSRPIDKNPIE